METSRINPLVRYRHFKNSRVNRRIGSVQIMDLDEGDPKNTWNTYCIYGSLTDCVWRKGLQSGGGATMPPRHGLIGRVSDGEG
jgi:hypothetical protein